MMLSTFIHRSQYCVPVLTQDAGPAKNRCGKKDALVQSDYKLAMMALTLISRNF
jgi:hypothetical protein